MVLMFGSLLRMTVIMTMKMRRMKNPMTTAVTVYLDRGSSAVSSKDVPDKLCFLFVSVKVHI